MWSIGEEARRAIAQSLQDGFAVLMRQLKLAKTADIVARFVHPPQLSYDRESEIVAAGGRIMWLRRRRNDWQTEVEEAGVPAKRTRVVIVGAGFGGLHAALQLEQLSSRNNGPEITLVNDENVFLFTPGRRDEESVCALYGWLLRSPAVRGAC
jgi:hypothetical protein